MMVVCRDCGRAFWVDLKTVRMLSESFNRNPELKLVCTPCGRMIENKYRKSSQ